MDTTIPSPDLISLPILVIIVYSDIPLMPAKSVSGIKLLILPVMLFLA